MTGISGVLNFGDEQYARYIGDFVDQMDPATRAHLAVAYQNVIPIISALHTDSDKRGESFTIEDFIIDLDSIPVDESDEILSRRHHWILFAALLARLEKLGRRTQQIRPMAATIWTLIITEYPRLKALLPHNVVWTDAEKEWFELGESDGKLMENGINFDIPPQFAREPIVEQFARSLGVFYWPQKTRIGFVP